jgi:hypothetical protein
VEFPIKLEPTGTEEVEKAAAGLEHFEAATTKADAALKAMDISQQKAAARAVNSAKAFNPEAYKKQIQAQEALKASQEKALQQLGLGLSKKEQEQKASAAAAEKEKKRARELATLQAGNQASAGASLLASRVKAATAAFVALGVASAGVSFATMVIGWQSAARLQMISYKLGQNFRAMFKGVDAKPLERAFLRLTDMFSMTSVFGRNASGLLTRTFNSFFRSAESGVPVIEAIADGLLLAGMRGENAWLRARIALVPYTSAISRALGKVETLSAVSYLVAGAVTVLGAKMAWTASIATGRFVLGMLTGAGAALRMGIAAILSAARVVTMGVAATGAAAPFLALAAAIAAVVVAADQFSKLSKEWDGDLLLRSLGFGESDADKMNRKFDEEAAARKKAGKKSLVREVAQLPAAAGQAAPTRAKGAESGKALADGLVAGMKAKEAEVAAGGAGLAKAADAGVRAAAQIRSPSRLMAKEAGYMGEGVEQGLERSKPGVQRAAEQSLVPTIASPVRAQGAAVGAAGASTRGLGSVTVTIGTLVLGEAPRGRSRLRETFEPLLEELCMQVEIAMGGPVAEED